ncbi:hypothetical protein [Enterococcus sp. DIV0213h]|jgi:hypothetical protein|uniref:hypothetical protein n=1 Tax=Enterococcus sp. DIV0213h TaxID=2774669 RepID=UPI003F1F24E5
MNKTILEFAKENGLTKSGVRYHLSKLGIEPSKENGTYILNSDQQALLLESIGKPQEESESKSKVGRFEETTSESALLVLHNEQIEQLKSQINYLQGALQKEQELVAREQSLRLAEHEKYLKLEAELNKKTNKWWHFWKNSQS